jgi:tetratricopeptide (TPR) repeat protein
MGLLDHLRASWLLRQAFEEVEKAQRREDVEAAVPLLRRAAVLQPGNKDVWNELAYVLGHLGRLEEALEAARRAVSCCPGHPKYHNAVVGIQSDLARRCKSRQEARGPLAQVLAAQRRLIDRFPDYPPAHLGNAEALAACGEGEAAWEAELDLACALYEQQSKTGSGLTITSQRLLVILQNSRESCRRAARWWQALPEG